MKKVKPYHLVPILCFVIYVLTALSGLIKIKADYSAGLFLSMLVIQLLVFLMPSLVYSRLRGQKHYKTVGLRFFGVNSLVFIILCALFMFFGSSLIKLLIINASDSVYTPAADLTKLSFTGVIYLLIIYCLLPAVLEELVFRGIVLNEYKPYGVFCAVILSSALFSMLHFSLRDFFVYFFSGIILALIALVTRSLFACMLAHLLNNLLVVFAQQILWQVVSKPEHFILFIFIMVSVTLLLLFLALSRAESILRAQSAMIPEEKNIKYPPAAERIRVFFISMATPGFLSCVAFFAVAAVITLQSQV